MAFAALLIKFTNTRPDLPVGDPVRTAPYSSRDFSRSSPADRLTASTAPSSPENALAHGGPAPGLPDPPVGRQLPNVIHSTKPANSCSTNVEFD